ncbi:MAG TPA: hypothetical protein VG815_06925 [Chloroflexota bacterium]|jgi:hypothetical protein|nr:hypothetical protein [Chloroflexota bacterium]
MAANRRKLLAPWHVALVVAAAITVATPTITAQASVASTVRRGSKPPIRPHFTVSPATLASGGPMNVSGVGWMPYSTVYIGTNTAFTLCWAKANVDGVIPPQTCTVPAGIVAGNYHMGAVSGGLHASLPKPLSITPSITVAGPLSSSAVAAPGETMTVSGQGFADGVSLSATLGRRHVALPKGLQTAGSGAFEPGTFGGSSFKVPNVTGVEALKITDGDHHSASVELTVVKPTITFSALTGTGQDPVSQCCGGVLVTAKSWLPYDKISINLVNSHGTTTFCHLVADSTGVIPEQACSPSTVLVPGGSYRVVANDGNMEITLGKRFRVTGDLEVQTGGFTPIAGAAPKDYDMVSGFGFMPRSTVTSFLLGPRKLVISPPQVVTTSAKGEFLYAPFSIPTMPAGRYPLTVKDEGGDVVTIMFTVT